MGTNMESKLVRLYQFKFYLNGRHSILVDGNQGQVHPHTWEFGLKMMMRKDEFIKFKVFEQAINLFFEKYQNQTLNDVKPFNVIMPTLESMVDYFGEQLRPIIRDIGGELISIEGSETPTRSYIVSYENESSYLENVEEFSKQAVSRVMDKMLEKI